MASNSLLVVDGQADGQIKELGEFIDKLKDSSTLLQQVDTLLIEGDEERALSRLVEESAILAGATKEEYEPAYTLLINLIISSPSLPTYLPKVISNLSTQIPNLPNGALRNLNILTILFNVIPSNSILRYKTFDAILEVSSKNNLFELVLPQTKYVHEWITEWGDLSSQDQRTLLLKLAFASEPFNAETSLSFLIDSLNLYSTDNENARPLAQRVVMQALSAPKRFEFDEILEIEAIQNLKTLNDPAYTILDIFACKDLVAFRKFAQSSWLKENELDQVSLERKIRFITIASLASKSRTLTYSQIASALDISEDEVELWIIDVIRVGLVEGRLCQIQKTFLVNRTTYRMFGKKEWESLGIRLKNWKINLDEQLKVLHGVSPVKEHGADIHVDA
ncbi:Eukaryotic translation initiation factor 3 subunit M [Neolecta irregularis DAH-3]|uniref:Eukaryotic translation initiation factor 3 subunit M n=1 Tax=Neolecta irregularis (strain DAH-3) TaxID=1198029 RepID=A0A1U7LSA7_NEOID|nr:Eukaryotic translation initiation factor 3 subunit M [Neolecta irregularis DAH-3]|eukprot:OLL25509.1 Eukaryotic translation initiation factor 3 subunit M [Neolecta irregularis DAH-3]